MSSGSGIVESERAKAGQLCICRTRVVLTLFTTASPRPKLDNAQNDGHCGEGRLLRVLMVVVHGVIRISTLT